MQSRSQWLTNTWDYLLDNIFDIITIIATLYIVVRHQFKPYGNNDLGELVTWVLAILGLLTVSGLWERNRKLKRITDTGTKTLSLVEKYFNNQPCSKDFFWNKDRRISSHDLSNASDIYVVGMVLSRSVRDNLSILCERVLSGANLKFVLLDEKNSSLMDIMLYRSYGNRNKQWWQNAIKQTEGLIEDISKTENATGTVSIGYLPHFPSFGMWLIDPDKPHGIIVVEIYHHRSSDPSPTFTLQASQDSYWYGIFRKQFDILWQSCQDIGRIASLLQ